MLSSDIACCVWQIFIYSVIFFFFSSPPPLILLVVSGKGAECSARLPTDVAHFSTLYKSFNQTIPPPAPRILRSNSLMMMMTFFHEHCHQTTTLRFVFSSGGLPPKSATCNWQTIPLREGGAGWRYNPIPQQFLTKFWSKTIIFSTYWLNFSLFWSIFSPL